jgi:DNA replication protein DnaC
MYVRWNQDLKTPCDDMGLKVLPPKSGEIFLEIIIRRYENRSTMMTSNRPIEE